ncbi:MAG: thioredoxin [Nitrospirota bacterium]
MGDLTVKVETSSWEKEVLNSDILVMVDFWANWCGPCRMIAPIVEEIATEYSGRLKVAKVNTDESPELASRYKIMGIPALLFFKDGKAVDQVIGAVPKSQLKSKIDSLLNKTDA